jgi:hypothetical protein
MILQNNRFFVGSKSFQGTVFRPEFVGRREGVERQRGFLLGACPGAVVENKTVAVRGEPARAFDRGAYELGADIALAEVLLVHKCRDCLTTSTLTHHCCRAKIMRLTQ